MKVFFFAVVLASCIGFQALGDESGDQARDPQLDGNYEKLDLKPGDVIRGIDGQPAEDPQKAIQQLSNGTRHVEIVRDGTAERLNSAPGQDAEEQR